MKLFSYVTLGLLASTDAAQKRSKKSKKVKLCHSIKKGENIAPLIDPDSKKKTCKCLVGWKKSKSTDPLDGVKKHSCNRANYSLLKRASMVRVVEGANIKDGEAAWAEEQATSRNCVYVRDAHWIKCDNYGMDNKKIKKLILPYTIESADFSNNHLTELVRTQWEGLMNLKKVSFQNNFLKKIPISILKAAYGLEGIDISYNQLTELNSSGVFKKNVNVKSFKANNNMLKDIKKKVISSWKHLEYVDVSNNRMTKLSGGMLVHAVDLWYVNFSNNKINKLATKAFSNNNLLRELHLNNNAISNINKNVFSKLPNLEILDLSYNKIGEGRESTKNDPDIHRDGFRNLKSVKKLLLNNNQIQRISPLQFKGLKNLELLNIDHNNIEVIPEDAFKNSPNLKFVVARYNQINTIAGNSFDTNPALKIAYLSHNELSEVQDDLFAEKPDLKRVDLGDNQLTSVGNIFQGSQANMYNTYLYQNAIASVDQDILSSASELAQLDVSSNKLADGSLAFVPEVIEAAKDNMQWVNLKRNSFKNGNLDALHTNMEKLEDAVNMAMAAAAADSNQL